ncbi:MAG TPA: hypothetical protein VIF12_03700 [Micavibrio sp.]|jgi:hypothetical protein
MFGRDNAAQNLTPEKYRQLLEQGLAESVTGSRLLRFAAQQRISIQVIAGKGSPGYIPDTRSVFISLPPNLSTVSSENILELGAYLRQAELQFLGHKNPDDSMNSHDYTVAYDAKMIDSLAIMCRIASELYDTGNIKFIDALVQMGHGKLYETYKKYGQGPEFSRVYFSLVKGTN